MGTTELAVVDEIDTADVLAIGTVVDGTEDDGAETGALALTDGRQRIARWSQRGMVSAEWAVGIIAAVALAGVLIAVITDGPVQNALLKFVLEVIHSFSGYVK